MPCFFNPVNKNMLRFVHDGSWILHRIMCERYGANQSSRSCNIAERWSRSTKKVNCWLLLCTVGVHGGDLITRRVLRGWRHREASCSRLHPWSTSISAVQPSLLHNDMLRCLDIQQITSSMRNHDTRTISEYGRIRCVFIDYPYMCKTNYSTSSEFTTYPRPEIVGQWRGKYSSYYISSTYGSTEQHTTLFI